MSNKEAGWDWEISNKTTWLGSSLRELYAYKDLLVRLVRKEILTQYQQTLFGPLWVLLQPLLTVLTYLIVFNQVLKLPTGNIPPVLYYLSGITLWNLFSEILLNTAGTFTRNAHIFQKVYFPRIIVPFSVILLNCFQFAIQFLFLLLAIAYYYFTGKINLHAGNLLLCVPVIVVVSGLALGGGLVFSVITAKYRDLSSFLPIVIRLLMFLCPIFYSLSTVSEKIRVFVQLNPLAAQFEAFRYSLMNTGELKIGAFIYSTVLMVISLTAGLLFFNKKGDQLIDVA